MTLSIMKINSKASLRIAAWVRGGVALAIGVGVVGCGGGSNGPRTRPTPTPIATAVPTAVPTVIPTADVGEIIFISKEGFTTMNPDGSNRVVVPNPERDFFSIEGANPKWFPRRQQFIYNPITGGSRGTSFLVASVNRDGTNRQVLAPPASGSPNVSPDGQRIAYIGTISTSSQQALFVANADGTSATPLNFEGVISPFPTFSSISWSPDGRRIAFIALVDQPRQSAIFTVNADGTDLKQVSRSELSHVDLDYSPNGRQLVFSAALPGLPINREIFTINVDGSGEKRLITSAFDEESPTWSPDGRRIAFAVIERGPGFFSKAGKIHVMNADGSNQINISNNDGIDTQPDWN